MSDIKVKFRGVRGSYPVVKRDHLDYGGNDFAFLLPLPIVK